MRISQLVILCFGCTKIVNIAVLYPVALYWYCNLNWGGGVGQFSGRVEGREWDDKSFEDISSLCWERDQTQGNLWSINSTAAFFINTCKCPVVIFDLGNKNFSVLGIFVLLFYEIRLDITFINTIQVSKSCFHILMFRTIIFIIIKA